MKHSISISNSNLPIYNSFSVIYSNVKFILVLGGLTFVIFGIPHVARIQKSLKHDIIMDMNIWDGS